MIDALGTPLENYFSTVAESEKFRKAKANFFSGGRFRLCVRACVAIISRAVWKLRNGLRLRGNFEIGKEQCTRKNEKTKYEIAATPSLKAKIFAKRKQTFPEVAFGCACAPVAITSRAVDGN